jgi:alpha-D-ribose 1-methylphosphonate 5-triphosphate synthase subunit PhnH
MTGPATLLAGGFADPPRASQRAFRAVLDAMAHPGRVHALVPEGFASPPLGIAAGALLLTLTDADTPVWLHPACAAAAPWLRFHAGCPIVAEPADAAFAVAPGEALPPLHGLAGGTAEAPHLSATLLVLAQAIDDAADAAAWCLHGPGIATTRRLAVAGLAADFPVAWAANHARFPCGIDVIFCAGDRLAALPRSVRLDAGAPG